MRRQRVFRHGPRDQAPTGGDTSCLSLYLRDVESFALLPAHQEQSLLSAIEEAETTLWRELLDATPFQSVLAALPSVLPPRAPGTSLQALQSAIELTKADKAEAARALRRLDRDRRGVGRVLSALEVPDLEPLHRARAAERRAQRLRNRFLQANLRLVLMVARSYRQNLLPLEDLVQEGNIGLMTGLWSYERRVGVKFSTYAVWWIRHHINRALADKGRLVRVPVHVLDTARKIGEVERQAPTPLSNEDLAHVARPAAINRARMTQIRPLSINEPLGRDGGEGSLQDVLADASACRPDERIATEQEQRQVELLLDRMPTRTASILAERFGLDGQGERTLQEIAQPRGLSRERIRQVEAAALADLRRALLK